MFHITFRILSDQVVHAVCFGPPQGRLVVSSRVVSCRLVSSRVTPRSVPLVSRVTETGDDRLLLVRCVQRSDAGLYRVTIQNDAGRMQATARLSVIGQLWRDPPV